MTTGAGLSQTALLGGGGGDARSQGVWLSKFPAAGVGGVDSAAPPLVTVMHPHGLSCCFPFWKYKFENDLSHSNHTVLMHFEVQLLQEWHQQRAVELEFQVKVLRLT